jgi:chromate transporter
LTIREHHGEYGLQVKVGLTDAVGGIAGRGTVAEVAGVFLRLGCTAFGGPAAHIAMMRREVVQRRRWLTEERFLDLLGATNLIPGPNSTEMAIHLGYLRAGWPGLVVAGTMFIAPAMVIVLALAWAYVSFGTLPQADALLYGVKPVIIAVVAQALYGLARTALKRPLPVAAALLVLALSLLGLNELALLFGGGVLVVLAELTLRRRDPEGKASAALALASPTLGAPVAGASTVRQEAVGLASAAGAAGAAGAAASAAAGTAAFSLSTLFLTFLKIGAVLYGSGYVLLAFLHGDFVDRLG